MNPLYPIVASRADHRCEYCHAPEAVLSRRGRNSSANLALACRHCNLWKSNVTCASDSSLAERAGIPDDTPLFNPRTDRWADHFEIADGYFGNAGPAIIGKTTIGRFTARLLRMNDPRVLEARKHWAGIGLFP
jgi:hypothetical protein